MKINTLFNTGAMKSIMSLEMYKKLKLNDLNTSSIPHVVGASGESLGARGRTKCEININGKIFYQTFIVCKHLKSHIILDREPNTVTPFVILNFSHHEHLHLPKDHIVAFAEKACSEGEVLEICTMEQLEKDLPRNWIPERK